MFRRAIDARRRRKDHGLAVAGPASSTASAPCWSTEDYLDRLSEAGFVDLEAFTYRGDQALVDLVPEADRLRGLNILLALRAQRFMLIIKAQRPGADQSELMIPCGLSLRGLGSANRDAGIDRGRHGYQQDSPAVEGDSGIRPG